MSHDDIALPEGELEDAPLNIADEDLLGEEVVPDETISDEIVLGTSGDDDTDDMGLDIESYD